MHTSLKIVLCGLVAGILFTGDATTPAISVLAPFAEDSTSHEQGKALIVSVDKESVPSLVVSTMWNTTRYMDVSPKVLKESFPKDFYKLFDPRTTLQQVVTSFRFYGGYSRPDTLAFAYRDTVTIRSLWAMPALARFAENVQAPEVLGVVLSITGWKDSAYTAVFDDPASDGRALYKIHLQLIPGSNSIYLGAAGRKENAVEYRMSYTPGYQAIEDRSSHFHNSSLEQVCTTCHEGLPSADSGATMKADCGVCHKAFDSTAFVHAPVEMKECGTCHAWSAEKKVVAAVKPVPELCYGCHGEKQAMVDSSASQHPVAGECLTCHSPHGSNTRHQLKADVYTLCTGCHDDKRINHPVGRHQVRFAKIAATGEEISCVSCHNPHGSPNASLLRVGGGRMAICLQCHDK